MAFAVPVKYMVPADPNKEWSTEFCIIDTSSEGRGRVVAETKSLEYAHLIAYLLNKHEGYEYPGFD